MAQITETIKYYKPTLRRQDMQGVLEAMADEAIGPGERKAVFEENICDLTGFNKAYALRTMALSLEMALSEMNLPENARILVSPLSPSVYGRVITSLGYELAFADTDKQSGIMNYTSGVEKCDAIILYIPGASYPDERFKEHKDRIIVDISKAVGMKGFSSFAKYGVCSFEANDVISCGGGAVFLSEDEIESEYYQDEAMSDLNASLGCVQYKFFNEFANKRREIYQNYQNAVMRSSAKNTIFGSPDADLKTEEINAFSFSLTMAGRVEEVMKLASKSKIEIVKTFEDSLAVKMNLKDDSLTNSVFTAIRTVSFPLYYFLKSSETERVSKMLSHLM